MYLEIESERWTRTKTYDIKVYFNFPIANFQFIYRNIQAAPVYG